MKTIQFIEVSPTDLSNLINEGLKSHIESLFKQHSEHRETGKEFLTRKETAEFFGISLVCVHDWVKSGIVTPYKMGNRTYFNRAQLVQQLFDSNKVA